MTARLTSGPNKGRLTTFTVTPTPGLGTLNRGERIRVTKNPPAPPGADPSVKVPPYSFTDFDRRLPMVWLGLGFVVLLLVTGRLHGLRALSGWLRVSCSWSSS